MHQYESARRAYAVHMNDIAMKADPDAPLAAAIVDDKSLDIDALLARIVKRQQAHGLRVRGFVMKRPPRQAGRESTMFLVDVETGIELLVSQPMGANSRACRADHSAFAKASLVLRDALGQSPDIVVSNRFGDLEVVHRGGFTAELLAVMERGIPLLTTVAARNAAAWREFTGGAALLPADEGVVTTWLEQALQLQAAAT